MSVPPSQLSDIKYQISRQNFPERYLSFWWKYKNSRLARNYFITNLYCTNFVAGNKTKKNWHREYILYLFFYTLFYSLWDHKNAAVICWGLNYGNLVLKMLWLFFRVYDFRTWLSWSILKLIIYKFLVRNRLKIAIFGIFKFWN